MSIQMIGYIMLLPSWPKEPETLPLLRACPTSPLAQCWPRTAPPLHSRPRESRRKGRRYASSCHHYLRSDLWNLNKMPIVCLFCMHSKLLLSAIKDSCSHYSLRSMQKRALLREQDLRAPPTAPPSHLLKVAAPRSCYQ